MEHRSLSPVAAANLATWSSGRFVSDYSSRRLRPVEVLMMVWFREHFSGRVLEVGCGAGRVTSYIVMLARETYGVEISADMIDACRFRCPQAQLFVGDGRDLSRFSPGSLDLVFAGWNVLDVFSDAERREVLREIQRVLAPDGLLIMSSHNRAYLPRVRRPWQIRCRGVFAGDARAALRCVADIVRAPRRIRRHRRLRRLEQNTPDYAIVSDGAHDFALVHYFISREAQFRQLAEEGFEPVLAADLEGRLLNEAYVGPESPEIHYAARKAPRQDGDPVAAFKPEASSAE